MREMYDLYWKQTEEFSVENVFSHFILPIL